LRLCTFAVLYLRIDHSGMVPAIVEIEVVLKFHLGGL
jgi:hypothetical protein